MTSKIVVNNIEADAGVSTVTFNSNVERGSSNLHSVGIEVAGVNTLGADTPIGTGSTIYDDGGVRFSGIVTATSFRGDGGQLTGISVDSTKIETGNTKIETIDTGSDGHLKFTTEGTARSRIDVNGHFTPEADNTYDLGTSSLRWRDIYTGDLNLSNEGRTNDVDGTWGNYTIQEGESDLFLINNRTGKKYKFLLQEVE